VSLVSLMTHFPEILRRIPAFNLNLMQPTQKNRNEKNAILSFRQSPAHPANDRQRLAGIHSRKVFRGVSAACSPFAVRHFRHIVPVSRNVLRKNYTKKRFRKMASMCPECPVDVGGIQDSRGMRPDSQDLMP